MIPHSVNRSSKRDSVLGNVCLWTLGGVYMFPSGVRPRLAHFDKELI